MNKTASSFSSFAHVRVSTIEFILPSNNNLSVVGEPGMCTLRKTVQGKSTKKVRKSAQAPMKNLFFYILLSNCVLADQVIATQYCHKFCHEISRTVEESNLHSR